MANTVAQIDRLAREGYQATRERDGCARCRFSEVDESGGGKVYYCTSLRAEVNATGLCRRFADVDRPQLEIPFGQHDIREVAEAIGLATVYQLIRHWPGRRLHVPMAWDPQHPLVLCLGPNAAERLVRLFAGQYFDLPTDANAWHAKRDAAIIEEIERGESLQIVAERHGLTRQAVRFIYGKQREREAQA